MPSSRVEDSSATYPVDLDFGPLGLNKGSITLSVSSVNATVLDVSIAVFNKQSSNQQVIPFHAKIIGKHFAPTSYTLMTRFSLITRTLALTASCKIVGGGLADAELITMSFSSIPASSNLAECFKPLTALRCGAVYSNDEATHCAALTVRVRHIFLVAHIPAHLRDAPVVSQLFASFERLVARTASPIARPATVHIIEPDQSTDLQRAIKPIISPAQPQHLRPVTACPVDLARYCPMIGIDRTGPGTPVMSAVCIDVPVTADDLGTPHTVSRCREAGRLVDLALGLVLTAGTAGYTPEMVHTRPTTTGERETAAKDTAALALAVAGALRQFMKPGPLRGPGRRSQSQRVRQHLPNVARGSRSNPRSGPVLDADLWDDPVGEGDDLSVWSQRTAAKDGQLRAGMG